MRKVSWSIAVLLLAGCIPALASAQQDGVFNCSKNGATAASAGSTQPLNGTFVPVADYAVELNTGLLVYKECVLRNLVVRRREAATTQINANVTRTFTTGRNGNAYFSRNIGNEQELVRNATRLRNLQNGTLSPINDAFETTVRQSLARGYTASNNPSNSFVCNYNGDLRSAYSGTLGNNFWAGLSALTDNPVCNPLGAYYTAERALAYDEAFNIYEDMTKLDWGDGVYPVEHFDEFGRRITDTPGAVVLANGITAIQSGYNQLAAANDIGQMVGALYSGVMNQVLSGTNGLIGLTQNIGSQPSYLDQVVANASGGLVTATNNATIAALQQALATEKQYNAAQTSIATTLSQTISALRAKETQCFTLITEAVCTAGTISNNQCVAKSGGTQLKIATQTTFSQTLIDANIRALATAVAGNLNGSNAIITKIQQLITTLGGTPTAAAQTAALAALTALQPHTGADVNKAATDLQSVVTQMAALLQKASTDWGDNTDPQIGWCNVNNPDVAARWTTEWSN